MSASPKQPAHALGDVCVKLVYAAADVRSNPDDQTVRMELNDHAKAAIEKVIQ